MSGFGRHTEPGEVREDDTRRKDREWERGRYPRSPPRGERRSRSPDARRRANGREADRERAPRDGRGSGPGTPIAARRDYRGDRGYQASPAGSAGGRASPRESLSKPSRQPSFSKAAPNLDSFTRTLHSVLLRTGKRELARRALDRLVGFHADDATLADAQRAVESSERDLHDDMLALQGAFGALMQQAQTSPRDGIMSGSDMEGLRDRIVALERLYVGESMGKGKAREASPLPPPSSHPPPEPSQPPPSAPPSPPPRSDAAGPSTAVASVPAVVESEEVLQERRSRIKKLLHDVLDRLEGVEGKMADMILRCDDLDDQMATRDMEWDDRTRQWDEFVRTQAARREARRAGEGSEAADGDASGAPAANSAPATAATMTQSADVAELRAEVDKLKARPAIATSDEIAELRAELQRMKAEAATAPAPSTEVIELRAELDKLKSQLSDVQLANGADRLRDSDTPAAILKSLFENKKQETLNEAETKAHNVINNWMGAHLPRILEQQLAGQRDKIRAEVIADIAERTKELMRPNGSGTAAGGPQIVDSFPRRRSSPSQAALQAQALANRQAKAQQSVNTSQTVPAEASQAHIQAVAAAHAAAMRSPTSGPAPLPQEERTISLAAIAQAQAIAQQQNKPFPPELRQLVAQAQQTQGYISPALHPASLQSPHLQRPMLSPSPPPGAFQATPQPASAAVNPQWQNWQTQQQQLMLQQQEQQRQEAERVYYANLHHQYGGS